MCAGVVTRLRGLTGQGRDGGRRWEALRGQACNGRVSSPAVSSLLHLPLSLHKSVFPHTPHPSPALSYHVHTRSTGLGPQSQASTPRSHQVSNLGGPTQEPFAQGAPWQGRTLRVLPRFSGPHPCYFLSLHTCTYFQWLIRNKAGGMALSSLRHRHLLLSQTPGRQAVPPITLTSPHADHPPAHACAHTPALSPVGPGAPGWTSVKLHHFHLFALACIHVGYKAMSRFKTCIPGQCVL